MLRPACRAALGLLVLATGCTKRLYEGPTLQTEQVAMIQVGTSVVREIDGQKRRGGLFDVSEFEVTPGPHRLVLVFELPARNIGLKTIPAQVGVGTCVLEFSVDVGRQYFLGSRPLGEFHTPRWDGSWEGWVRDPAVSREDDVIARCVAQEGEPAIAAAPIPTAKPPATSTAPAVPGTQYCRTVSDHLPIVVRLRATGDDD